jgi:hypothetical protein
MSFRVYKYILAIIFLDMTIAIWWPSDAANDEKRKGMTTNLPATIDSCLVLHNLITETVIRENENKFFYNNTSKIFPRMGKNSFYGKRESTKTSPKGNIVISKNLQSRIAVYFCSYSPAARCFLKRTFHGPKYKSYSGKMNLNKTILLFFHFEKNEQFPRSREHS